MRKYFAGLKDIVLKPTRVNTPPLHIQLEPSTKCNLNCITCSRKEHVKNPHHLSFEQFKYIIDAIMPRKLTLSGVGEPLLNPSFFDMVRYTKSRGISVNTSTNGTIVSNLTEEMVSSRLDLLKISIDSARKETFTTIRGQDLFEKVIRGVNTLQKRKQKLGSTLPYIRFQFVIQRENIQEIEEIVELAYDMQVDAINFQILELSHVEERKEQLVGNMTLEELKSSLISAEYKARRRKLNTNLSDIISNLDMFWHKYSGNVSSCKQCILPWFSTYIDIEGNLRPCCAFALVFGHANLGNIFSHGVAAWNSKRYQKFRNAIRKGKRPYKLCKNCIPQSLMDMLRLRKILPGFMRNA